MPKYLIVLLDVRRGHRGPRGPWPQKISYYYCDCFFFREFRCRRWALAGQDQCVLYPLGRANEHFISKVRERSLIMIMIIIVILLMMKMIMNMIIMIIVKLYYLSLLLLLFSKVRERLNIYIYIYIYTHTQKFWKLTVMFNVWCCRN